MQVFPKFLALSAVLCALVVPGGLCAQTIYMKDGQVVPTQGLRREAETVLARIQTKEGSVGEIGYPVANITRIDFPEPAQIKLAGDLLNAGKNEEAVRQLTPILAYYAPFRDLPGNWWTPLALLQVDALARLGRDKEVDALVGDITRYGGTNADTLRAVKIKQAAAVERRGDHHRALDALDPLVKDPGRAAGIARRGVADGRAGEAGVARLQGRAAGLPARARVHAGPRAAHAPGPAGQRGRVPRTRRWTTRPIRLKRIDRRLSRTPRKRRRPGTGCKNLPPANPNRPAASTSPDG